MIKLPRVRLIRPSQRAEGLLKRQQDIGGGS